MAEQRILQLGNPLLWQKSAEVETPVSDAIRSLIRDLEDTLSAFRSRNGFGRGIAAPQIGVLARIIYIHMDSPEFHGPMINPKIMGSSDLQIELWDDCFSFPDLLVKVRRASEIRVEYQTTSGESKAVGASNAFSELLQHEIDHLDGILATDRAISPQSFITRSEFQHLGLSRN